MGKEGEIMSYYFRLSKFSIYIRLFEQAMEQDSYIYFMFDFCGIFHFQIYLDWVKAMVIEKVNKNLIKSQRKLMPKKWDWRLSIYWNKKVYLKGSKP